LKTAIIITVVVVVLLGGAIALIAPRFSASVKAGGGSGLMVRTEKVSTGDLIEIVTAPGTVRPETKVSISARVSARIVELPFREGDRVTKGDPNASPPIPASVLVKLDDTDLRATLRSAEANYAARAAELETARARIDAAIASISQTRVQIENEQRNLKRQEALLGSEDVSESVVDDARARVNQLIAQLQGEEGNITADRKQLEVMEAMMLAAAADVDQVKEQLSYTTIVSPIDGVVTTRDAEVGELAIVGTMNNPGTQIMEVADLSKMLVDTEVDEADVANVEKNQKCKIRIQAYRNIIFEGYVENVALAKTTDEVTRGESYITKVVIDTAGHPIVSGLNADVDIHTREHKGVIRVPNASVLGRNIDELPADVRSKPEIDMAKSIAVVVFRKVDGKAIVTPVKIGASDLSHTIILAGLNVDDEIITGPYKILDTLQNNQAVQEEKPTTQPTTKP